MNDQQAKKYFLRQARAAGLLTNNQQLGGYAKGFKLARDPEGRREFKVEVNSTLRQLLNLPEEQTLYGSYYNKKVIEAARRAYTEICRDVKNRWMRRYKRNNPEATADQVKAAHAAAEPTCPELTITMLDVRNPTAKSRAGQASPPKASTYHVKRVRAPTPVKYKGKDRPVVYQWKTQIIPIKRGRDIEGSAELKEQRRQLAKQKYQRLAKKPSRYPLKGIKPVEARQPKIEGKDTRVSGLASSKDKEEIEI